MDLKGNFNDLDGPSCSRRAAENKNTVDSSGEQAGAEGFQRTVPHTNDFAENSFMNANTESLELTEYIQEASSLMKSIAAKVFGRQYPSYTSQQFLSLANAIDEAHLDPSTINMINKDVSDYVFSAIARSRQEPRPQI